MIVVSRQNRGLSLVTGYPLLRVIRCCFFLQAEDGIRDLTVTGVQTGALPILGMVEKVGSDLFGPATIKNFESQGIDATYVRIADGVSSGVAPIFVDPNGENRIIVVKGDRKSVV